MSDKQETNHDFARSRSNAGLGYCKRCGGVMVRSKAIGQTYTGTPDFPGCEVVTMSPGGHGRLIDCDKCTSCGYSVTPNVKLTEQANAELKKER